MPKTYTHLLAARRMPTEYELVSSALLYHPQLGVAVRTPVVDFMARYPLSLTCTKWDEFRDPRETTYASYVNEQRDKEIYLDQLLASIDGTDYDRSLDASWLDLLERGFAPLRYPCHGLHMLSAYIAQAAPSGRVAIAAAFQTGDEMRRVQRLAYRTKQLMLAHPTFGADAQQRWERDARLQPLRKTIEYLLVSYEWGEAFIALNFVVKPLFDEFLCAGLAGIARERRDDVLARLLLSLRADQLWHRAWARALVQHILSSEPGNAGRMREIVSIWQPRMLEALAGLVELTSGDSGVFLDTIRAEQRRHLAACGLGLPLESTQPDAAWSSRGAA